MDTKLIGEQIAKYRKERNLTQEELGKALEVSTQAIIAQLEQSEAIMPQYTCIHRPLRFQRFLKPEWSMNTWKSILRENIQGS